jgi:lipoprotein NlpI
LTSIAIVVAWALAAPAGAVADSEVLPPDAAPALHTCEAQIQSGDLSGAVASCTKVLNSGHASDEEKVWAYGYRGLADFLLTDADRAIDDFNHLIELRPKYAKGYNGRAMAQLLKKDYADAIQDLNKALELDPGYAEAYRNRANLYQITNDPARARSDLDKSIELAPDVADPYLHRGDLSLTAGDFESAIQDYDQVIRLQPQKPDAERPKALAQFFEAKYSDAAGTLHDYLGKQKKIDAYDILILYIAEQHASLNSTGELDWLLARLPAEKWPAPLVAFFQGHSSEEDVLKAAADAEAHGMPNQICFARFFFGQLALLEENVSEARHWLELTAKNCPADSTPYMGARAQLNRM